MEITTGMVEFKKWLEQSIKDAQETLGLNPQQIDHILFIILRELDESTSR